jgi:hypothetical protein
MILGIGTTTVIQHLKMARERYQAHCKQSHVISEFYDGMIRFCDQVLRRDPQ